MLGFGGLILTAACSSEIGLGVSEVAAPRPTCVAASAAAVAAVEGTLARHDGVLTSAMIASVPSADRGFDGYPEYILAAKHVSLFDPSDLATWALSGRNDFRPIYPLNDAARLLTDPTSAGVESDVTEHFHKWDRLAQANLVRECASTAG